MTVLHKAMPLMYSNCNACISTMAKYYAHIILKLTIIRGSVHLSYEVE